LNPAPPIKKTRPPAGEREDSPPVIPPVALILLTCISGGVFLWIWALMWGHWIKRVDPSSRVNTLTYVNVIPGALFYINLPSLLLAKRANDVTEIARLHIGMVLWGTVAIISLIATGISIFRAQRNRPVQ